MPAKIYYDKDADLSLLKGKTLGECGLREQDILVLTLTRKQTVISNPKPTRTLRVSDRLLCYGRLDRLRVLIPPRKKQRARRLSKKKMLEATAPAAKDSAD